MARISIKKNFVDGDKLFAQQLNNNFETIEKAVNDGNKIVWQDGTEVTFKRYVTSDIDSLPISDGAIIYDTEKGRHYIDYQGKRIQVGSAGKEVVIQEEQPTEEDNKLWIDSDTVNTIGTEIVNEHTESETLGYSANYLNKRLVKVSSTQPETGEEVWIQKAKNLFDKTSSDIVLNNYISSNGYIGSSSVSSVSGYIEVDKNTIYTLYINYSNDYTQRVIFYDENKNYLSGTEQTGTNPIFTFTTPSEVKYIRFQFVTSQIDSTQLEIGDKYTPKKIHTKNDNGIYEEFYDETNLEVYSTSEQRIGTWIDGKPLYRRVLSFPNGDSNTLTGAAYTLSEYGITNVSNIFITHPSYYSYGKTIRYPFSYNDGNAFECNVDGARLIVKLSNETIANSPFLITLEYTKTTD